MGSTIIEKELDEINILDNGVYLIISISDFIRRESIDNLYKKYKDNYELYRFTPENRWSFDLIRSSIDISSRLVALKKKVIIYEDFHKVDDKGYVLILKSLEELSKDCTIILTSSTLELQDVILSRINRVYNLYNSNKYYKAFSKKGVKDSDIEWLIKNEVPLDLIDNPSLDIIIGKLKEIDTIVNQKNIDIIDKSKNIYKISKEIIKISNKKENLLLEWLNLYLKKRALNKLYNLDYNKGYEKVRIIESHRAEIKYNINMELYIYNLLYKLSK